MIPGRETNGDSWRDIIYVANKQALKCNKIRIRSKKGILIYIEANDNSKQRYLYKKQSDVFICIAKFHLCEQVNGLYSLSVDILTKGKFQGLVVTFWHLILDTLITVSPIWSGTSNHKKNLHGVGRQRDNLLEN